VDDGLQPHRVGEDGLSIPI